MYVLEALRTIQIIYQIACLSPCIIDHKTWTLTKSRLLQIYCLTVIMGSLIFMIFDISSEDFIKTTDDDLGVRVDFIQMLGIRIAHLASITEGFVRWNKEKQIYAEVQQIDLIFERSLNVYVNNKKFRRTTIILGVMMTLTFFASEMFILILTLMWDSEINQNFNIFWYFYLMPSLICSIRYFQMFTSIRLLRYRLNLLVNVLSSINLKAQAFETKVVDDKYSLTLLECSVLKNSYYDMESPELRKLIIIREVYNRLFNLSEIINCYFGISMLINIGNDFISIISSCYWIFYSFHAYPMTTNNFLIMAASFVWALPHWVNVSALALLCDSTVQRTNKIALNLHRINIDIWNDNHNIVIEQFSLQLLHQKMSINAAGFFTIDCTLLYTIVAATTTYLIILIQFYMNESTPPNGHKHNCQIN